ncbi:MAG TPA: regulatory iron-sulfur-containing complex subunit RicT [Coriobacteriia bacterium]
MPTIVGVKLRFSTKPAYHRADDPAPDADATVIVRTERGLELGHVVSVAQEPDDSTGPGPFDPIERVATEEDLRCAEELEEREREAMRTYREFVKERGLDMKPIDVEYLFDGSRIVFYFVAEERVDFRDLVRDLATRFHARIDMRQVGVRDEARMIGGLGHCGEQLCCSRFGGDFQPVSIRMAKEQDLPLNPLKISGLCGRLMCCLRYEFEAYKDFKGRAPKRNAIIDLPDGAHGKVIELNTPKEEVTMLLEGGGRMTVPLSAMDCGKGEGCTCPCRVRAEALPQATDAIGALLEEREEPRPRAAQPKPAAKSAPAEEQPQREGTGRRRRRRGGGGGSGKPAEQAAEQAAEKAPKPQASASPGGEGQAATPGRRRRRRRSSGGGEQASKPE